jgi:hypothetical protein
LRLDIAAQAAGQLASLLRMLNRREACAGLNLGDLVAFRDNCIDAEASHV